MLGRLADFTIRRRHGVLLLAGAVLAVAAIFGGSVADDLNSGGLDDANAESAIARRQLDETFGAGDPNVVLLVTAKSGTVDDAEVVKAGARLTAQLGDEPDVSQA